MRGTPMSMVFAVQLATAMAMHSGVTEPWRDCRVFEWNSEMAEAVYGRAHSVEYAGDTRMAGPVDTPGLFMGHLPGGGVLRNIFDDAIDEDADTAIDMPENWIAPVAVLDFQAHDYYLTVWTRTDEMGDELMDSIKEYVLDGCEDQFVMPVQPQPPSDLLCVFMSSSWVFGLGLTPAVIDLHDVDGTRFLVHLDAPITVAYVRQLTGPKWRDGLQIFVGSSSTPLKEEDAIHAFRGILISVRNHDSLPPIVEWTDTKILHPDTWARNTREEALPRVDSGIGKICLLGYRAPWLIAPVTGGTTSLSMRDTVSQICDLQPESFLLKPPRTMLHDLNV